MIKQFYLLLFLIPFHSNSQTNIEDLLNDNRYGILIYFANSVYHEDSKDDYSLKFDNDSVNITMKNNHYPLPCFACQKSSADYDVKFELEKLECTSIQITSSDVQCSADYLSSFLERTKKMKWKKDSDGKHVTAKPILKLKEGDTVYITYIESYLIESKVTISEITVTSEKWKNIKSNLN